MGTEEGMKDCLRIFADRSKLSQASDRGYSDTHQLRLLLCRTHVLECNCYAPAFAALLAGKKPLHALETWVSILAVRTCAFEAQSLPSLSGQSYSENTHWPLCHGIRGHKSSQK